MSNKTEEQDDVIRFFLTKFTEERLFKASAEQWLNSGKASGSFRDSLHNMLESWAASKNTWYKNEVASLESQLREKDIRLELMAKEMHDKANSLQAVVSESISPLVEQLQEKDKEIERLKELGEKCRKLIENCLLQCE